MSLISEPRRACSQETRMSRRFLTSSLLLATLAFLTLPAGTSAAESLRYELGFERPSTHLMDVTIRATDLKGPAVEFAMPDWAPGSYGIQDYADNIQHFRARSADGKELRWRKADSQTWRIELAGANAVMSPTRFLAILCATIRHSTTNVTLSSVDLPYGCTWWEASNAQSSFPSRFLQAGKSPRAWSEPAITHFAPRITIGSLMLRWRSQTSRKRTFRSSAAPTTSLFTTPWAARISRNSRKTYRSSWRSSCPSFNR